MRTFQELLRASRHRFSLLGATRSYGQSRLPTFCDCLCSLISEKIFHSQLDGPRPMRVHGMQERAAQQTTVVSRREVRLTASVTIRHIVSGISRICRIIDSELCVVEDVESLEPELQ